MWRWKISNEQYQTTLIRKDWALLRVWSGSVFGSGRWGPSPAFSAEIPEIRLMATFISTVSGFSHPHDPSPFVHPREDYAACSGGHRSP
jgi:hypothetical protein